MEATRERRARRRLERLGLALRKDRARTRSLDRLGGYMIIDPYRNWIVAGERFELSLEDVEAFIDARRPQEPI